jgi:ankyrin repeat protein
LADESGWTSLMYASQNGDLNVVRMLLGGGADPNVQPAQKLVDRGGASVEVTNSAGLTPLILAAVGNHPDVIAEILRGCAHVSFQSLDGDTALRDACTYGWWDVAQMLVQGGASCDFLDEDFTELPLPTETGIERRCTFGWTLLGMSDYRGAAIDRRRFDD